MSSLSPTPEADSRAQSTATVPSSRSTSTPLQATRSGRIRKSVTKFGSMVDSDIISDPEDNADHGADEEDDGEGWDTSAEDDDDDGDFDMDGDASDEDGKKKRKSTKQSKSKKPSSANKATIIKKTTQPKISNVLKSTRAAGMNAKPNKGKLEVQVVRKSVDQADRTSLCGSKKRKAAHAADEAISQKSDGEGHKDSEIGNDAEGDKGAGDDDQGADTEQIETKSSAPSNTSASSTKPSAKKVKTGVSLAPSSKASTTSTKTSGNGSGKKGFVPLRKTGTVELKPAGSKVKEGVQSPSKAAQSEAAENEQSHTADEAAGSKAEEQKGSTKATKAKVGQVKTKQRKGSGASDTSATRKLAPAEKLTVVHRLSIAEAFSNQDYLKQVDIASVAAKFDNNPNSAKLARHCREVLMPDVRALIRDGSIPKSKKSDSQGAITTEQRVALWAAVCKVYDKANWKGIEETTGMTTTKLKRHFRDVMHKEVEKAIKGK